MEELLEVNELAKSFQGTACWTVSAFTSIREKFSVCLARTEPEKARRSTFCSACSGGTAEQSSITVKKSAEVFMPKDKASEIEKAYEEKLRLLKLDNKSIPAREKETEKQLATASPQIHQCTAYMTSIQQSFGNVVSIISSIKVQNLELSEKLQAGMKKILEQLISQVS